MELDRQTTDRWDKPNYKQRETERQRDRETERETDGTNLIS